MRGKRRRASLPGQPGKDGHGCRRYSAACSTTVTVLTPALAITQAASTATATPGSVIQYTITVADTMIQGSQPCHAGTSEGFAPPQQIDGR